jgi:hypothetical protein
VRRGTAPDDAGRSTGIRRPGPGSAVAGEPPTGEAIDGSADSEFDSAQARIEEGSMQ